MRFVSENCTVDFGDESGIFWYATVTVDTDYDSVYAYKVNGVSIDGKVVRFDEVSQDLRYRIRDRMSEITIEECSFSS